MSQKQTINERIEDDYKKVVDLDKSRVERHETSVKLRSEKKEVVLAGKRGLFTPPKMTFLLPEAEIALMKQRDAVNSELHVRCAHFTNVMQCLHLQDPPHDPYDSIHYAISEINASVSKCILTDDAHRAWAVVALLNCDILTQLTVCLSHKPILREDDDYAIAALALSLIGSITSMADDTMYLDKRWQEEVIPVLFSWCRVPLVTMRCAAMDCLANICAVSTPQRDKLLASGFLNLINDQFSLPDQESSEELWAAASFALAMIFHQLPLPNFSVVNTCLPGICKLINIEMLGAMSAGLASLAFICNAEDKNYTKLIVDACDKVTLAKIVEKATPADLKSGTDLSNAMYSLNVILGLTRDTPECCAVLLEVGLVQRLKETLLLQNLVCILKALMIIDFIVNSGGLEALVFAGVFHAMTKGMHQKIITQKNVRAGIFSVCCTAVTNKRFPPNYETLKMLAKDAFLVAFIADGLKHAKFSPSIGQRGISALQCVLLMGEQNMDPATGVNEMKVHAENADIVTYLREIDADSENKFISEMASAVLTRYFEGHDSTDVIGGRAPVEFHFNKGDTAESIAGRMTEDVLFGRLAEFFKTQEVADPGRYERAAEAAALNSVDVQISEAN